MIMKAPVIVNMACGLANRMFQYAFYRYLLKCGYNAYVDYFTKNKLVHEDVLWSRIFPQATFREASVRDIRMLGGGHDFFSKIRRKILPVSTRVIEMKTAFDFIVPPQNKALYILGVFQNAEVVDFVDKEIREAFVFPDFEKKENIEIGSVLINENSVGIHVRKGNDYQTRIWYQNTCNIDYYKRAVDFIRQKIENPKFYVFTDNIMWVKNNMSWLDYKLIGWNPGFGWGSHCDMQLISLCKHNIISNSTYSWWGAYLNNNIDKVVVCPKVWFNPHVTDDFSSEKLMVGNWFSL